MPTNLAIPAPVFILKLSILKYHVIDCYIHVFFFNNVIDTIFIGESYKTSSSFSSRFSSCLFGNVCKIKFEENHGIKSRQRRNQYLVFLKLWKNVLKSVQTCFYVLQTRNQTHTSQIKPQIIFLKVIESITTKNDQCEI